MARLEQRRRGSRGNAARGSTAVRRRAADALAGLPSVPIREGCCDPDACAPVIAGRASAPIRDLTAGLKALADPTRLAILQRLLAAPEAVCVCDLTAGFEVGQPTISHHLKRLRQAGFLRAQRRGTWIYYRADPAAVAEVARALADLPAASAGKGT